MGRWGRVLAGAAVALASLGVAALPAGAAPTPTGGTIEGVVYDDDGPVEGVVVQLYEMLTSTYAKAGKTNADGEYRITSVPPGVYKAVYRDPTGAHVTTYDGSGDATTSSYPPGVRAGETLVLDRHMVSTASLGGVVTDGETPLGGMKVALYREGAAVKVLTTAADGTWSATGLEPGSFTVGYSDPARAFVPEYNGDAVRKGDAAPIEVEPAADIDVDAALARR